VKAGGGALIAYDATRDALLSPYLRDTVFNEPGPYSDLQICVEAARLAYFPAERKHEHADRLSEALQHIGFDEPTWFVDPETDTQAFGTYRAADHTVLLAIRGTEPDKGGDLCSDVEFWKTTWLGTASQVHMGFAKSALALLKNSDLTGLFQRHEGARLLLTGHSLGAAIATLVATVHKTHTLVLLGSPRVGDDSFCQSVQAQVIHRLVNCCDIITRIPPVELGFAEVGTSTYIDASGTVHTDWLRGDARIDADRSQARMVYLRDEAWGWGKVLFRDLADHAPINYIRAFF
jgi:Lipase (class 3)